MGLFDRFRRRVTDLSETVDLDALTAEEDSEEGRADSVSRPFPPRLRDRTRPTRARSTKVHHPRTMDGTTSMLWTNRRQGANVVEGSGTSAVQWQHRGPQSGPLGATST